MPYEILSLLYTFGIRSEHWLYKQITGLKKYRVYVITYKYINQREYPYSPVKILPLTGRITKKILKLPIFLWKRDRPRLDLREMLIVSQIIEREKIKLIQAHFGWTGWRFLELSSKFSLPYLVWLYGSDVFRAEHQSSLQELIASRAIFCCTSNALREQIEAFGCARERINVFHPGIEIPPNPPKPSLSSHQTLKIISIGRLVDVKDPIGLVEVAKILKDRGIKFLWKHYGDGQLRPLVKEKIKKYHLEKNFFLQGEVPNQKIKEAMSSADLMVHNNIIAPDGAREAFGVVLVEASSYALPIVSVRVGGIPEIVQDQKTGFLLEMGDLEGIAEKVILLAKNPELRLRMGQNAYQYVRENFEINQQTKKLESFYSQIINAYRL